MLSTLDGLLHHIVSHPDDTAARLVYADLLEEQGQGERAEFIRVQCELAKPEHQQDANGFYSMPYTAGDLLRRQQELQGNHLLLFVYPPWWNRDGEWQWKFRRGFVEEVSCSCNDWYQHGPAVVRTQPILRVRLTDKKPHPYGDGFYWFGNDNRNEYYDLPECIMRKVVALGWWFDYEHGETNLKSEQAALDALAVAALAWARTEAGLPPLNSPGA